MTRLEEGGKGGGTDRGGRREGLPGATVRLARARRERMSKDGGPTGQRNRHTTQTHTHTHKHTHTHTHTHTRAHVHTIPPPTPPNTTTTSTNHRHHKNQCKMLHAGELRPACHHQHHHHHHPPIIVITKMQTQPVGKPSPAPSSSSSLLLLSLNSSSSSRDEHVDKLIEGLPAAPPPLPPQPHLATELRTLTQQDSLNYN